MQTIINLAVKFSGLGWIWDRVDGYKTKISAAISILSGLAGVLEHLSPALAAHNAGQVFAVLKAMPSDPAWIMLVGGLGLLGIGHKIDKANEPEVPAVAPKP